MEQLTCTLIHGDCINELQKLIKKGIKVDLIVTDPPYLMNYYSKFRINKEHGFCKTIKNDDNFDLIPTAIPLLFELLKNNGAIYMFCNSNHIDYFKQELSKYFDYKNILIWVKNNWSGGDTPTTYAKQTEFILYMSKGKQHKLNGGRNTDVLYYDRVSGKNQLHQNQKPIELLEFLITKSSQENDVVLDCFMGSGSTGVACLQTNRNFIGIELDEKHYNIAKERCREYQSKLW